MDYMRKMTATLHKDGEEAMDRVREVADAALEKSRQTWKNLRAQGKEAVAGAQKSTEEAWDDAQKLVRKQPGKTVVIAFSMGTAIGALLAYRRRDKRLVSSDLSHSLFNGIVTAGAGYALSRLANRFGS